jgi:hypothetical protein
MTTTTAPPAAQAQRLDELRAFVKQLATDYAWREEWNRRHESPNGWEAPIRIAGDILDSFEAAIGRGDLVSLDSREKFLRSMLSGELFDAGAIGFWKKKSTRPALCQRHVAKSRT